MLILTVNTCFRPLIFQNTRRQTMRDALQTLCRLLHRRSVGNRRPVEKVCSSRKLCPRPYPGWRVPRVACARDVNRAQIPVELYKSVSAYS